jgi:hypothetical protein
MHQRALAPLVPTKLNIFRRDDAARIRALGYVA